MKGHRGKIASFSAAALKGASRPSCIFWPEIDSKRKSVSEIRLEWTGDSQESNLWSEALWHFRGRTQYNESMVHPLPPHTHTHPHPTPHNIPTIIYVTCGMNTENLVHSLLSYFSLALLINNAAGAEAASSRTGEVRSSPQSSDCTYIKRLLLLNSPPLLPDWEISHFPLGLLLVELCEEEKCAWAGGQNLGGWLHWWIIQQSKKKNK